MTVRAEQQEKAQNTLASIFKISEGKVRFALTFKCFQAQKLLDKKMKAVTEQVQKEPRMQSVESV